MTQRHDHDTVERLWPGAADPADLRFVPVELRTLVAGIDPALERKLRRELLTTREVTVTDGSGRQVLRTLNPAADEADLETALVVAKNRWARTQLAAERDAAERAEHDRRTYTCPCCATVVQPDGSTSRHTQQHVLADGRQVRACAKCAAVCESLAVDRLAAEMIDGKSRADRARKLLEASRP